MIKDGRMHHVGSEDGFDYYEFTPGLFRQYYNKTEDWTPHRKSVTHKLHMLLYQLRGGYRILYMMDGETIAAYLVYARCGRTVIRGSTRKDIFTVFVTTHPDYRKRGLATRLVGQLLHGFGPEYDTSYKTISDSNEGSRKAAAANGYRELYPAKRTGLLKTIVKADAGTWRLYAVSK